MIMVGGSFLLKACGTCKKSHLRDGIHKFLDAQGMPVQVCKAGPKAVMQLTKLYRQQPPLYRIWLVHNL